MVRGGRERLAGQSSTTWTKMCRRRAGHDQARTLGGAVDLLAAADLAALPRRGLGRSVLRGLSGIAILTSLSDLAADLLAGVPDALALVGLGLAELADVRCHLADGLLVDALDREPGRALDGERDAVGGVEDDRVAVAERELELRRALGHDAVADADDLEPLLVALGDADDHVVDQRAGQAVQRAAFRSSSGRLTSSEPSRRPSDRDRRGDGVLSEPLGPLTVTVCAVDRDVDARRDRDGSLPMRDIVRSPSTRRRRGLPRLRPSAWPDGR